MFDTLSDRLGGIFDNLTRRGVLKEQDVDEAMRRRLYETGAAQLQANLGRWKRQTHPKGLAVYNRAGQGCYRCLGRIRTTEHGDIGRRTWWCADCQT